MAMGRGFPTIKVSGYRDPMPTWCPRCERNMTKGNWRHIFLFGDCPYCGFRFA